MLDLVKETHNNLKATLTQAIMLGSQTSLTVRKVHNKKKNAE